MRLVHGFKTTEILPPAVSDRALEYPVLRKTSLYINFFLMPCFLFSVM